MVAKFVLATYIEDAANVWIGLYDPQRVSAASTFALAWCCLAFLPLAWTSLSVHLSLHTKTLRDDLDQGMARADWSLEEDSEGCQREKARETREER